MKSEKNSFLRTFLILFISNQLLLTVLFILNYNNQNLEFDNALLSNMQIDSFELKQKKFKFNFEEKTDKLKQDYLYKSDSEIFAYYSMPNTEKYYMKLSYSLNDYNNELDKYLLPSKILFAFISLLNLLTSILFTIYSLRPLKTSIKQKIDFLNDVSHDINTPLSIIELNTKMLRKKSKIKK